MISFPRNIFKFYVKEIHWFLNHTISLLGNKLDSIQKTLKNLSIKSHFIPVYFFKDDLKVVIDIVNSLLYKVRKEFQSKIFKVLYICSIMYHVRKYLWKSCSLNEL